MKKFGLLILITMMSLTGCVSAYDLTEEESDVIATYAANVVLKHDKNFEDTLVNISEESDEDKIEQEETKKVENNDKIEEKSKNQAEETEAEEESTIPLATALGLTDFQIDFVNYETDSEYVKGTAMTMNATEGSGLLIMHFNIKNNSSQEEVCDILTLKPKFSITINDEKTVSNQLTILLNDLATYSTTVGADETVETVLISEIEKSYMDHIESLTLSVTVDGKTSKVIL